MLRRFLRLLGRSTRGTAAIELCVIGPIITILVGGMTDFGLAFIQIMQVREAADAGARYAVVHGWDGDYKGTNIADVVNKATNVSLTSASASAFCGCPNAKTGATSVTNGGACTSGSPCNCTTTCSTGFTQGTYVTITAKTNFVPIMPWPGIKNPQIFTAVITVRTN